MLSRRVVLKGSALAAASLLPWPGRTRVAFAAEPGNGRILVVLHLRGGCDGLNLLSPASDPDFIAARGSELRVMADGADAGHSVVHAANPAVEFRLHHTAGALAELAEAKHLAFVHAAGLTDSTRSHFVATDMMERGVADGASLNRAASGWLARSLQSRADHNPTRGLLRGVSTSGSPSGVWLGDADTLSVSDLANGLGLPGGAQTAHVLSQLYAAPAGLRDAAPSFAVASAGRVTLEAMQTIDARLLRDTHGKVLAYGPETDANYDAASEFGRPLKTLAQLIKMDLGLEAATVDLGGWDTHEYQPGRFKNQVERLSQGLGAFYNDMSRFHDRLAVVVVTEFGRRLRSNRSNGTDHGRGSVMLVLGGRVAGGKILGHWPGLNSEQLDEGVDLAVANDYRQGLTEALEFWRGGPMPAVFPGFNGGSRLGLFERA